MVVSIAVVSPKMQYVAREAETNRCHKPVTDGCEYRGSLSEDAIRGPASFDDSQCIVLEDDHDGN